MIDVADVVGGQLHGDGWPFWGIVTLLIGIAIVVGSFNGYVSSRFQVHPLIVTLGTGFAIQGGVLLWSGGLSTGSAPSWLASAVSVGSTSGFLPVPPVLLVWAVVAVVLIVTLRRTTFGREVYALGSNPTAARLALVRPNLIWASAFTVSTLCATVVGLLLLGFTGSVYGDVGSNYLFLSIGAVVVGGTSLLGGSGGYAGTIMGALILTELQTILIGLGLSEAALETVLGALVIAVVAVTGRQSSLGSRI
jgi:ribose transport system permease protein